MEKDLLCLNNCLYDINVRPNITEYKIEDHRMVSGWNRDGKTTIVVKKISNKKSNLSNSKNIKIIIGETHITPIRNKFLLPSPNVKDGETDSAKINKTKKK